MGFLCGCCKGARETPPHPPPPATRRPEKPRPPPSEKFRGKPRLPKLAVPKSYDVRLKPDLRNLKFTGSVSIDIDVVDPDTNFIVLNAADINIDLASVTFTNRASAQVYKVDEMELVTPDEILVLEFKNKLPPGKGILDMNFNGFLNDKMKGFYTSTYELKGEKKNMAVTQFEPVDARRCFPCWDEPAFKATFKITLDLPSNPELVALSNMPIDEEKTDGLLKTESYKETPIMSTYLVAIVIGAFDYVEEQTSDGIKVRVCCRVGKENQGKFALDVAVKTLKTYEKYLGARYALPKLDMVAIPDFASGAMENYGLITYREADLLYDDPHSGAGNKQKVAIVVAREVAHQWFGNLVTMEWWTHLWLNKGFATWLSYHVIDQLFPQWKIWSQFLDITADGLRLDALEESHPIEVEIKHASESREIFDAISYNKGASIIRMLHSHLGDESFKRSIASYIEKYQSSNAKTEDLWAVLEEQSEKPVKKIMASWTKRQGFPVVSVTVKDQQLRFEQSQFLASGIQTDERWVVPITLCYGTTACDVRKNFLLETKSKTENVKEFLGSNLGESGSAWIKLNVNQTGFYRVKYEENLMARLRSAIKKKYLIETDRFGLLDDSFALCMARHQSLTSLLTLMDAYQKESDYSVLTKLINITYKIEAIAAEATTPELLSDIKEFFIHLLQNSAEKLGWDTRHDESHLESMLRGEVLMALALFGHGPTLSEANRRFQIYLKDRNTSLLPPDIRKAAYVAVMQQVSASDRSGYESLLKVYREADLSQEKARILSSLATCRDAQILQEFLNFLLSSEVRRQDAIHGLNVRKEGYEVAWTWLKAQWNNIWETWGSGSLITCFVSSIVSPLASLEKAEEVKDFFVSLNKPSIDRTWKQSVEQVRINAKWVRSIQNEEKLAETVKELAHRSN